VLLRALPSVSGAIWERVPTFSFMYLLISGASASRISIRLICSASTTAWTLTTSLPGVAVRARTRKYGFCAVIYAKMVVYA